MRQIDHIVYSVPNLEEAMEGFKDLTGIAPSFGGYHTTQGTKNAVVNLGNSCYLELLAIDETNLSVSPPRWMGVDYLDKAQITRWALKSSDLKLDSQILKSYQTDMGVIQGGQRKTTHGSLLTWEMVMPLAYPQVEILPFMTDWQNSEVHPTDSMPEECQLIGLEFTHPNPDLLQAVWEELGLDLEIAQDSGISISMKMDTPKGIIEI